MRTIGLIHTWYTMLYLTVHSDLHRDPRTWDLPKVTK